MDVESKELHKMEETEGKETKEKMKLSTIRTVVISETCLLIIRHKKKVMQVDPLVYYFYHILGQKSNALSYCWTDFQNLCIKLIACQCTKTLWQGDIQRLLWRNRVSLENVQNYSLVSINLIRRCNLRMRIMETQTCKQWDTDTHSLVHESAFIHTNALVCVHKKKKKMNTSSVSNMNPSFFVDYCTMQ